jgi:hypothetical protein
MLSLLLPPKRRGGGCCVIVIAFFYWLFVVLVTKLLVVCGSCRGALWSFCVSSAVLSGRFPWALGNTLHLHKQGQILCL